MHPPTRWPRHLPDLKRDPRREHAVDFDHEGIFAGAGQRQVEHHHGRRLDINHTGRWLIDMHRAAVLQDHLTRRIEQLNRERVRTNLGAPAAKQDDEIGPCMQGRKLRDRDVPPDPDDRQLAELIDQRVIAEQRNVGLQRSAHTNGVDDIALADGVDHIHSAGDLAEDRVHTIEVRLRRMRDEEL